MYYTLGKCLRVTCTLPEQFWAATVISPSKHVAGSKLEIMMLLNIFQWSIISIIFSYCCWPNIARIANAVQCHSKLSGHNDCHEFWFSAVWNVNNITQAMPYLCHGLYICLSVCLWSFIRLCPLITPIKCVKSQKTFSGPFWHLGPDPDQVPNSGPYRSQCE